MPLRAKGCCRVREYSRPDHRQELAMIVTKSNELIGIGELNVGELDRVSGGGLFSFVLRLGGFNSVATIYEKLGGPDVTVGVKPAY
jgi:hypothetical protein